MTEDERLVEILKRMRPYASFWEWPDKGLKEHGIIKDFIDALSHSGILTYQRVEAQNPDPPDFKATDSSGRSIGIEITELVSEAAISENIKAQGDQEKKVYKDWLPEDVVGAIQERLTTKCLKKYNGAFDEIHVVIFTDEPALTHAECEQLL